MSTGTVYAARPPAVAAGRRKRSRLLPAAIVVATVWAFVPVALLVVHTLRYGGVISGSDGPLAGADQLFYMDQIRQSAQHLLITDHFDLAIGHAVFLNPLYLLGGVVWLLGAPLQAAFWSLKLLAAPLLALAAVALAVRTLDSPQRRAAAVGLGLFYMSPLIPLLDWSKAVGPVARYQLLLPAGESMPAWQLWGYPHSGVAVALLALASLGSVSIARGDRSPRLIAGVAVASCLCGWLHPWQGATLVVVLLALGLEGRSRQLAATLAIPLGAVIAPLAYELVLSHTDAAWRVDSAQNTVVHVPWWAVLAALGPIAAAALAGIRGIARGPMRTVLVVWPLAALAIYFGTSQFPYHALEGISLPLAMLAVAGWPRLRGSAPAAIGAIVVLALAMIPGAAYELKIFRDAERSGAAPYFLSASDHDALSYLDRVELPGGVLARDYLGMAVPAFTGRRTWVGEWTWTPDYTQRAALAERLMDGGLSAAQSQLLVASSGARFVLRDCAARAPLGRLLGPLVVSVRRFGCAAVYQVRRASAPSSRSSAA